MPLPTPNLDDRRFQDILDEARRRIPELCPAWTDHNLSDPGITLLELFAWMTEMILFRLNRVPDKTYIKFLELIGVRMQPARAATTELMFRMTAPQIEDFVVPRGTAVATEGSSSEIAVVFTTDRDLVIKVPHLTHLLACYGDTNYNDYLPELANEQRPGIFSKVPQPRDRIYFGFSTDLRGHTVVLDIESPVKGINVNPYDPPLAWEFWNGVHERWQTITIDRHIDERNDPLEISRNPDRNIDTTGGFNRNGRVLLTVPLSAARCDVEGRMAFWLRCSVIPARADQHEFDESPQITRVDVQTVGGLVTASHSFEVLGEELAPTDGTPGQRVYLHTTPILPRLDGQTLQVQKINGEFEAWHEVSDFGTSRPDDKHFTLDDVTGAIEFGPRIRTPAGEEHQFGAVPAPGLKMRYTSYRSGGGADGNVGARTLKVPKTSVPFIEWVINPDAARGGTDAETIEHAKWRGPQVLRSLDRAVTPDDFERLACVATSEVGRAHCLMSRDGTGQGVVELQLVPALEPTRRPVPYEDLQVSPRVQQVVQEFLDERRLLTCELHMLPPAYIGVSVVAHLKLLRRADRARVLDEALAALYRYIHPMTGGPDGRGWPFERPLYVAEVYALLQAIPGVDVVENANLFQVDPASGRQILGPANQITPGSDGLLCSAEHRLQFS